MARLTGRLAACIASSLLLTTVAQASDIACHHGLGSQAARCDGQPVAGNTCRHADKPPSGAALICDYTMLRGAYERVYAEQLQLLRTGEIGPDDIAAWRRHRDACTSVPCLDRAFANWRDYRSQKPVPPAAQAPPAMPAQAARNARKSKPEAAGPRAEVRPPPPVVKPVPRETQQERRQETQQEKKQATQQEKQQAKQQETQQEKKQPETQTAPTQLASPATPQPSPGAVVPSGSPPQPVNLVAKSQPFPDTVPPPAPQLSPDPSADRKINESPIAPATIDRPLLDSAPLPTPQSRPQAVTKSETPERPITAPAISQPSPGPATLWTPAYPVDGSLPGRWEPLGALAWLSLCGACMVRWCRRRQVPWLPDAARRRQRTRTAARIVLVSAGLIAVNSIVLFWILA
ncbi:hypothetical protein CTP10_R00230 [Cupriavidus sp. P-10]|uniref:hypothetical protein n=1 Tax=Cupriavidus sp. P-10 TaxID=2027911 RepID=UPI000E2E9059|nr:hypothetical protein [Cupriavidus sp. P-10]BDB22697.1 hypothetical protein CTP10_R00230 [Cupriavidus sp. P-10]